MPEPRVEVVHPAGEEPVLAPVTAGTEPTSPAMELWISHVLRWGVVIAAIVILVGGAIFLLAGPAPRDPHSLHDLLHGDYSNRTSLQEKVTGLEHRRGLEVVDLGLMLLVLTPVLRVAMTFALFFIQKDWIFAAVTAVVLCILVLGLSGTGV